MQSSSEIPIGSTIYAPGKLVIAGEYAVLDGAPAISLAINRGVKCAVKPFREGHPICTTPAGDSSFVYPALSTISTPAFYEFQDWNPVKQLKGTEKPGFGGSAAACVASCYAANLPLEKAFALHHQVQGSGSGIDIATSIYGGMIWAENKQYQEIPSILPVVVWTGNSAKTGPRVKKYNEWKYRETFVKESSYWTEHFSENPVLATRRLFQNLSRMAQESNLDYLNTSILDIVSIAESLHGGAKPSGAGGGDCVIAFFPNQTQTNLFVKACQKKYLVIPIAISQGVYHTVSQT